MIVEVIAVGTELLLGQIVNTNVADIGRRLAEDGVDVHHQVTVGDNLVRIADAIGTACSRADAVVLTGGIGPTQDDLTRDAICALLGVGTATDTDHREAIRARLAERGVVADTALRMADYPEGATPLPNRVGVALGIAAVHRGTPIFAVPGVPSEMRGMIDDEVRPRLRAASGEPAVLSSLVLHCWGLGESQIAERLDDLYASSNPSIAFLITGPEVRVRITAKAATPDAAGAKIAGMEQEVRDRLGDAVFAANDETVGSIVAAMLAERTWAVASVESSTRGLLAGALAGLESFRGGIVVPAAGEPPADVEASATALLDRAEPADVIVGIGDTSARSVGGPAASRIGVALRTPGGDVVTTLRVLGDDDRARQYAVAGALHLLRVALARHPGPAVR